MLLSALVLLLPTAFADTCERAADRYEACVLEILGPGAVEMVRAKRGEGIPACRADPRTVALYDSCLPVQGCEAFMDCLTETAATWAPSEGAAAPGGEGRGKEGRASRADGPVPVDAAVPPKPAAVGEVTGAVYRPAERWAVPGVDLMVGSEGDLVLLHGTGVVEARSEAGELRFRRPLEAEDFALAVSRDGARVAVLGEREVVVLDRTGAVISTIGTGEEPTDVALSPSGALLALGDYDGLHLFDATTGKRLRSMEPEYSPDAVGFHPDGPVVYSSDPFRHNAFDVATGKQLAAFGGGFATGFHLSPDRTVLWTTSGDSDTPKRWSASTYERLERFPLSELIYVAIPAPAGDRWLLDRTVYELDSGLLWALTEAEVVDAAYRADGKGVLLGTDAGVEPWQFVGSERIAPLGGLRTREVVASTPGWVVDALAWSPDGSLLAEAWGDGVVRLWDVASRKMRWAAQVPGCELDDEGEVFCPTVDLGFSPKGDRVWVLSFGERHVAFDVATGAQRQLGTVRGLEHATSLSEGRFAVVDTDGALRIGPRPGKGAPVALGSVSAIEADPTGSRLVVGDYDGQIRVLDGTGKTTGTMALGHEGYFGALALSPDGSLVAIYDSDSRLEVREVATGVVRYAVDELWLRDLAFDPSGRVLAAAGQVLHLVDMQTGVELEQIAFAGQYSVDSVRWSPDGRWIAVAQTWETGDRVWLVRPPTGGRVDGP